MSRDRHAIRVMRDMESAPIAKFVQRHYGSYQAHDSAFSDHRFKRAGEHTILMFTDVDES